MTTATLDQLLQHHDLWRAADGLAQERGTLATGFSQLDAVLAGGGWPADGLTEILHGAAGMGELRLLLPALATLSQQQDRWIAWIAPPWMPYAPALSAAGVISERMLVVHPRHHQDQLWATEQALRSGTCSAVLSWPDAHHLRVADLRRLQLAAREGHTWGVLFRNADEASKTASPAELRLQLEAQLQQTPDRLQVKLLKRRGGWPVDTLQLECQDILSRRLLGFQDSKTQAPPLPSWGNQVPLQLHH